MMFNYQSVEIIGENIQKLVPSVQIKNRRIEDTIELSVIKNVIALTPKELKAIRKDDSQFPIKLTTTMIANDKLCIGIITDLSEIAVLKKDIN